ncbi:coth protein-domain-containing protein [Dichotomocladium elegans]|nr:coth protein-domain-containing protein [Dichotomocladium elegans]
MWKGVGVCTRELNIFLTESFYELLNHLSTMITITIAALCMTGHTRVHKYTYYSVIHTGKLGVVIDDQVPIPLTPSTDNSILHTGLGPAASQGYYYVTLGDDYAIVDQEPFVRPPVVDPSNKTPNEFYGRSWNSKPTLRLPIVYEPMPYIHRTDTKLHPDDEIPTFHFIADQKKVDEMHRQASEDISITGNMNYIRLDSYQSFKNVTIKLSGRNSRRYTKLSYNINLAKGDKLYRYNRLKLRALGTTDPSYIREELAYQTLEAMGVATSSSSFARLFINNKPFGLYTLTEHIKPSWLENEFAEEGAKYKNGVLYQGIRRTPKSDLVNHMSDLAYYNGNASAYEDGQYVIKEEPKKAKVGYGPLEEFTKQIHQATADVDKWNAFFDVEGFIRKQFVTGLNDNFWLNLNNYFLYQDPTNKQFIYIPTDTNRVFGNSIYEFDKVLTGNLTYFATCTTPSPLTLKLFEVPAFVERFNQVEQDVLQNLFRADIFESVIDSIVSLIEEDVVWDQSLKFPGKLKMPRKRREGEAITVRNSDTAYDTWVVARDGIPFEQAVNGPVTGHLSTLGVKEFISQKIDNIIAFQQTY